MSLNRIRTNTLEIAFDEGGSAEGPPVILLHGWPDAPCGWDVLTQHLQNAGYRTIVPYLRGSTPTEFLSAKTPRIGSGIALAQDAIDLADSLGLDKVVVIGHDWGARAAYTLAALFPKRVLATVALALAYQPRGIFKVPSFEQSRRFWYQWFLCTDGGAKRCGKIPSASLVFSGRPGARPVGSMTRSSCEQPRASHQPIGHP